MLRRPRNAPVILDPPQPHQRGDRILHILAASEATKFNPPCGVDRPISTRHDINLPTKVLSATATKSASLLETESSPTTMGARPNRKRKRFALKMCFTGMDFIMGVGDEEESSQGPLPRPLRHQSGLETHSQKNSPQFTGRSFPMRFILMKSNTSTTTIPYGQGFSLT